MGLLAGFLLVYVLIVGPVNYLVLRRRRRPDLAWVTIPLLIVIFSVGAYLIGYQSKGGALRLTTATLVQSDPGSPVATVDSFVGVFSPNRATYDLRFPGDVRLSEVGGDGMAGGPPSSGPPAITQGTPSGVPALHVDTWALRGFLAQTDVAYQPAYTAALTMSGATISGMVTNQGTAALQDVAVVAGGSVQHLGALAPGQQAAVQLTADQSADLETMLTALVPGVQVAAYPPPSNPTARAQRRRAALLAYLFEARPPQSGDPEVWVVGWGAPAPVAAQIAGESPVRDDLVLVAGHLPVRQTSGRVVLGPAQIPRQVVDGQVGPTAPGAPGAVMDSATFEFHLPANVQVDRLTLDYAEDKGGPPSGIPRLTIYNWRTQAWDDVLDASGNAVTPLGSFQGQLGAPAPYIAQDGAVRVRLEAGGSGGIIVLRRLDLRAEGVRAP